LENIEKSKKKIEKYVGKKSIGDSVYLKIDYDYLTSNDLNYIFDTYKKSIKEVIIEINPEYKKTRLNYVPLETVMSKTGNSIEIIFAIDINFFIYLNVEIFRNPSILSVFIAIDMYGRYLILKTIYNKYKINWTNLKNVKILIKQQQKNINSNINIH
jgi:hypothetical protein